MAASIASFVTPPIKIDVSCPSRNNDTAVEASEAAAAASFDRTSAFVLARSFDRRSVSKMASGFGGGGGTVSSAFTSLIPAASIERRRISIWFTSGSPL